MTRTNGIFLVIHPPSPRCRHSDGEQGGGGGEGGAPRPDDEDGQDDAGAARLGCQGPHNRLPPVHRDGQQREHGARDAQVGDEVVESAVSRAEDPISAVKRGFIGCLSKTEMQYIGHKDLKSDFEVRKSQQCCDDVLCTHHVLSRANETNLWSHSTDSNSRGEGNFVFLLRTF